MIFKEGDRCSIVSEINGKLYLGTVQIEGFPKEDAHILWNDGEITYLNDYKTLKRVTKL